MRFFKSTLLHSGRIVSLAPIPTSGRDQIPPTISSWWQQTSSAFSSAFVHPFPPENGRSNSPRKKQIHHSPSRPSQPTAFFLPSGNYIPAILSAGTPSSRAGPISVGSTKNRASVQRIVHRPKSPLHLTNRGSAKEHPGPSDASKLADESLKPPTRSTAPIQHVIVSGGGWRHLQQHQR